MKRQETWLDTIPKSVIDFANLSTVGTATAVLVAGLEVLKKVVPRLGPPTQIR
jgi:hypothetical protein